MENTQIFAIHMDSWTNTSKRWKTLNTNKINQKQLLNRIISAELKLWTKSKINAWVASEEALVLCHELDVLIPHLMGDHEAKMTSYLQPESMMNINFAN